MGGGWGVLTAKADRKLAKTMTLLQCPLIEMFSILYFYTLLSQS